MKRASAFVLGLSLIATAPVQAQLPSHPSAVPLYPGAAEYDSGMEPEMQTIGMQDYNTPMEILEQGRTTWEVEAAPEAVFAWYRERLPGVEMPDGGDWPMGPNGIEPHYQLVPYDINRPGDSMVTSGPEIRRRLEAGGRRPIEGRFVHYAIFNWSVPGRGGERTDFSLQLTDAAQDWGARPYRTTIDLQWSRFLQGAAASDYAERAEDERMDQVRSERMAEMASPPTESELGVASYRGAHFHRDLSVAMSSSDDERMYVFFSDDDPGVVRAFYERETGVTARDLGSGSFMIAIRGSGLMPEHGVLVGPTAGTPYVSLGRTMFAVRRVLGE